MKDFYEMLIEYLEFQGHKPIKSQEGNIVAEMRRETEAEAEADTEADTEDGKEADTDTVPVTVVDTDTDTETQMITLVVAFPVVDEDDLLRLEEAEGHRILVTPEDIPPDMSDLIPEGVEVWDRDELISRFGEMTLEKSVLKGVDEGEEGIKGPRKEFDFEVEHGEGERILKPIMDFEEVSELGHKLANGFKYTLELVPHYLFDYRVEKDDDLESGRLYLNAISGKPNFWKRPFKSINEIKRSHVKMEPNIPAEESVEKARDSIKNRYSEEKEERWEENGTTIVEKGYEEPADEDIQIEKKGVIYVPMWAVEGTEKIVVINAARGKVEREL